MGAAQDPQQGPCYASPEEKYTMHVRWMIGTAGFSATPGLEDGLMSVGAFGGCCFQGDHAWSACPCILGIKRAHVRANPTTTPQPMVVTPPETMIAQHAAVIGKPSEPTNEHPLIDNTSNDAVINYSGMSPLANVVSHVINQSCVYISYLPLLQ